MKQLVYYLLLIIWLLCSSSIQSEVLLNEPGLGLEVADSFTKTDLDLFLVSLVDGSLHACKRYLGLFFYFYFLQFIFIPNKFNIWKKIRSNGEKVWSFYDEPLVKTPALNLDSDHIDNVFIPNPVDGTLFKFHTGQPVQVQIQERKKK